MPSPGEKKKGNTERLDVIEQTQKWVAPRWFLLGIASTIISAVVFVTLAWANVPTKGDLKTMMSDHAAMGHAATSSEISEMKMQQAVMKQEVLDTHDEVKGFRAEQNAIHADVRRVLLRLGVQDLSALSSPTTAQPTTIRPAR